MAENERAALIVVDVQLDFLPGGALAVAGGDRILAPLAALMRSGAFRDIVATQDWHPPGHVSFASRHPPRRAFETIELYGHEQVLWPDHCVAGSHGADLHPALPWERVRAIVRKGTDPTVDSYSAFRNNYDAHGNRPPTGLAGYLRECGVEEVYVCGLARDFCVKATALDAADLGFGTTVLWDLTEPVSAASDADVRRAFASASIAVHEGGAPARPSATRNGGTRGGASG
jgi:nicotinamidase/pyrazinamidase